MSLTRFLRLVSPFTLPFAFAVAISSVACTAGVALGDGADGATLPSTNAGAAGNPGASTPALKPGDLCWTYSHGEEGICPAGFPCALAGYGYHESSYCFARKVVGKGSPCSGEYATPGDDGYILDCATGLTCGDASSSSKVPICIETHAVGQACDGKADLCATTDHCNPTSGVCAAPASVDGWCKDTRDCANGLYCTGWIDSGPRGVPGWEEPVEAEAGTCITDLLVGNTCGFNWQCASRRCAFGRCSRGVVGDACENDYDCQPPADVPSDYGNCKANTCQ